MALSLKWQKKGLIYNEAMPGFTFASHPCVLQSQGDEFLLAFTRRDSNQYSNIFLTTAQIGDGSVSILEKPHLALTPGPIGSFDCNGAASMNLMRLNDEVYVYYGSWQNLPGKGMWIAESGRARLDRASMKFEREFSGPIFGRCIDEPYWGTGPCLMREGSRWHVWYVSLDRWEEQPDGSFKHYYNIKHRYSADAIQWELGRTTSIPFRSDLENAIACPTVLRENGEYHMWYSFRQQPGISTYRIGYATSPDGVIWTRRDELAGIDVSPEGWDSQMICYAHVFRHKDMYYMLYNGNEYGKTGFGLAVCPA